MSSFYHNGIKINYKIKGEGTPFLYLHGLGDDLNFSFHSLEEYEGIKMIGIDQRGHGESSDDFKPMSFDKLANDALALIDHLKITNFFVGGLSMGAGVALNLAIHSPHRIIGLLLIRPSSSDEPMKKEVRRWFRAVSHYLTLENGDVLFKQDQAYLSMEQIYPRAVSTFIRYFQDEASLQYPQKFTDLSCDTPIKDKKELTKVTSPVLILTNKEDFIHPTEYGIFYHQHLTHSTYIELPSKSTSVEAHQREMNKAIKNFFDTFPC